MGGGAALNDDALGNEAEAHPAFLGSSLVVLGVVGQ